MVSRLVVLVLALFMFCTGFATQAQAAAFASTGAAQVDVTTLPDDDLPLDPVAMQGQAQADTPADPFALVMVLPGTAMPALTMSRPAPHPSAQRLTPYLGGPQRPPCATPLVA